MTMPSEFGRCSRSQVHGAKYIVVVQQPEALLMKAGPLPCDVSGACVEVRAAGLPGWHGVRMGLRCCDCGRFIRLAWGAAVGDCVGFAALGFRITKPSQRLLTRV